MHVENFLKSMESSSGQGLKRSSATSSNAADFKAAFHEAMTGAAKKDAQAATVTAIRLDNPLAADMWPDRFSARMTYAAEKLGLSVDEAKERFALIAMRAKEEGGFENPKGFLASLSAEEREVLQHVQGLADQIDARGVDQLDNEGALNLLIPPGAQRDFNNDGFRGIGEGLTFQMPPDSAPQELKDAWADLTEDMSFKDRLMAEGRFLTLFASANVKADASGKPVGIYGPRDPEYRNPFEVPGFSYREFGEEKLEVIERLRNEVSEAQYRAEKTFWTDYLRKLDEFGVETDRQDNLANA